MQHMNMTMIAIMRKFFMIETSVLIVRKVIHNTVYPHFKRSVKYLQPVDT